MDYLSALSRRASENPYLLGASVNRVTATPRKTRLPRPRLGCKLVECRSARWCQSMERDRRTQNPPSGPVTEVITRDIVPGREHEFERWAHRLVSATARYGAKIGRASCRERV